MGHLPKEYSASEALEDSYQRAYSAHMQKVSEAHMTSTLFDVEICLSAWQAGVEFALRSVCTQDKETTPTEKG